MTPEEQRYLEALADRGLLVPGTCVPRHEAVAAALARLDRLEAAGDALAAAANVCTQEMFALGVEAAWSPGDGVAEVRALEIKRAFQAALAAWSAARGGAGAGATQTGQED